MQYFTVLEEYNGKTENKLGGHLSECHITDTRNNTMEGTSRRRRRMEASSECGQEPEWVVGPLMEWDGKL
jgi:hypothetical protein